MIEVLMGWGSIHVLCTGPLLVVIDTRKKTIELTKTQWTVTNQGGFRDYETTRTCAEVSCAMINEDTAVERRRPA
jgi:hypothetical protein